MLDAMQGQGRHLIAQFTRVSVATSKFSRQMMDLRALARIVAAGSVEAPLETPHFALPILDRTSQDDPASSSQPVRCKLTRSRRAFGASYGPKDDGVLYHPNLGRQVKN
jgi:hypothetical protein